MEEQRLLPGVTSLRHGWPKPGVTRLVLDMQQKTAIKRAIAVAAGRGVEIRVSFALSGQVSEPSSLVEPSRTARPAYTPIPQSRPERLIAERLKPVIVIDPGHGGVDPGAISVRGNQEKNFTLSYGMALKRALEATGRYRVVLTRGDDRFIKLRDRIAIARKAGGQLFLSLHADSTEDEQARGLSVYTLSDTASDKEAEALAQSENKADIIAGIDLSKEDEDVTNILIDLAQRETKNRSSEFAEMLVGALGREVRILENTHRFAGFAVLKAPDVPAVLVEMGFLSNPKDEKELLSENYRSRIIRSITRAVDAYFQKHPNMPWK
ncbi:MAG: N-acetylmuramoyl-L-alanine amidase [Alphaproteobacteria bacterium]|nr:N-acetylmuramoyl-L-alanine amidase [Alphaproteobacteria bacterium]